MEYLKAMRIVQQAILEVCKDSSDGWLYGVDALRNAQEHIWAEYKRNYNVVRS